jgi:hypothetical protein
MTGRDRWTCLGAGPEHRADLEEVERLYQSASTEGAIHRCRACGQLYLYHEHELSDWTSSGDRYDVSYVWNVLEDDEVDAARRDTNYRTRSPRYHKYETGWR